MPSVYLAQHLDSNCLYIGKARHPDKRRRRHINDALKNGSQTYFHRAIRAHGAEAFEWCTLESFLTDAETLEAEEFWIAYFKLLGAEMYNKTSGGDGAAHCEETKKKISKYQKGRSKSAEHKAKIGASKVFLDQHFQKKLEKVELAEAVLLVR